MISSREREHFPFFVVLFLDKEYSVVNLFMFQIQLKNEYYIYNTAQLLGKHVYSGVNRTTDLSSILKYVYNCLLVTRRAGLSSCELDWNWNEEVDLVAAAIAGMDNQHKRFI